MSCQQFSKVMWWKGPEDWVIGPQWKDLDGGPHRRHQGWRCLPRSFWLFSSSFFSCETENSRLFTEKVLLRAADTIWHLRSGQGGGQSSIPWKLSPSKILWISRKVCLLPVSRDHSHHSPGSQPVSAALETAVHSSGHCHPCITSSPPCCKTPIEQEEACFGVSLS